MKHFGLILVFLTIATSSVSAARHYVSSGAAGKAVQPGQDAAGIMYDDGYGAESDYKKSSSTYDSYQYNPRGDRAYYSSDKHVLTLEMLRQDTNGQATPQVEQSANSTGLLVGLVCSQKPAYGYNDAEANPYSEDDEDTGPLIRGNPTPLEQIGKGRADIQWVANQKRVDIGKQKGLLVATISGEFKDFEDGAECNPLLTRRARITFSNVPVYAMITQSALPLDPSMLKRLVPFASGATPDPPQPPTPNATLPSLPGLLPLPALPGGAEGDISSTLTQTAGNGAVRTGRVHPSPQAAAAKVAVASAVPADSPYYDDQTLCGLTLVAKGPAVLRTQGETYAGSVESALLWTNGVVSLGGVTADAVAASTGQSAQSLFSTTVNQVLTSTTLNGISSAQLVSIVGNSASTTVVNATSRGDTFGGNVNVTQDDNIASANSDNATMVAGDSLSNNRVNVLNVVGGGLEQYLELLSTMCKHHKEIPESRPGTIRFDLLPVGAAPMEGGLQQ